MTYYMLLFTFYRNIAFITAFEHMRPLTELKNYFCLIILMPREFLLSPLPRTSVIRSGMPFACNSLLRAVGCFFVIL